MEQPWTVRYGSFLIFGNKGSQTSTLKLPVGAGLARDLMAHRNYPLGSKIPVPPGRAVVLVLPPSVATPASAAVPTPGPTAPVPNRTYTLTVAVSGLALEPAGGAAGSGTRIVQTTPTGAASQQWVFASDGSGGYTVKNVPTGLFLTSAGSLQQQMATNADDQRWQLLADGPGFVFVSKASGNDIDDPASSTTVGEGLGMYQWGGNLNQILHLTLVPTKH